MARTRAQDYDSKRQVILRRSAELFAQYGYAGTSITMIAEACGVSKALLYHYHPDKMAVLFDILHDHLTELVVAVEEAARSTSVQGDRLPALCGALLEAYRDADAQHQIQIASMKFLAEDKQEILRALERRLVDLFAQAIAEAVPQSGKGALLKPLTMSLFGMLNWHYLWFRDGKGLSREDYATMAARLVVAGADAALTAVDAHAPAHRDHGRRRAGGTKQKA